MVTADMLTYLPLRVCASAPPSSRRHAPRGEPGAGRRRVCDENRGSLPQSGHARKRGLTALARRAAGPPLLRTGALCYRLHPQGGMPMSDDLTAGRLEDRPFPALAGRIFREGRTGGLTLESGGRRRTVWFVGGNPAAVVSDDPQDHLAQFLREHGRIGEDEYARLAALPETREGLAGADFLPKETLNWGVKFRFVNLCYDLFRWEEGDYEFLEGTPPRELSLLKVPAHSLILKGVGYLGRARLIDLVPDESAIAAGRRLPRAGALPRPRRASAARRVPAGEHRRAPARRPGRRGRRAAPARSCTRSSASGLVALGPAAADRAGRGRRALRPRGTPRRRGRGQPSGSPGEAPRRRRLLRLAAAGRPRRRSPSAADDLEAALASTAGGPGRFPFDDGPRAGPPAPSTTPSRETAAAPARRRRPPRRAKRLPRRRGLRAARPAGRSFPGSRGSPASPSAPSRPAPIIAGAAWWWLGGGEAPPPPPPPPVKKQPAPAAPPVAVAAPTPAPPRLAPPAAAPAPARRRPPRLPPPAPAARTPPRTRRRRSPPRPLPAAPAVNDRYRNGLDVFRAGDLDGAAAIWEDLLAARAPRRVHPVAAHRLPARDDPGRPEGARRRGGSTSCPSR